MTPTVILSDDKTVDPTDQVEILEAAGASVEFLTEKTESAVSAAVDGAAGLIVDAKTPVTAAALANSDTLQVVGRALSARVPEPDGPGCPLRSRAWG